MKSLVLTLIILAYAGIAFAQKKQVQSPADSIKLKVDGKQAYYQNTVKADSVSEPQLYNRVVQFMASNNFLQTYGDQEEGKLIFTTSQDLNVNPVYVGDDSDVVDPYTVQFSITVDLKNKAYRYTIGNVVFFRPTDNGNKREKLYEMYVKGANTDSRRVAKDARKLLDSFEKYLTSLTDELYIAIKQKSVIYSKF